MNMMHHNRPRVIAIPADLLPAVLADGDTATTIGPDLRAGTTITDAEDPDDAVQLARQFRAFGFTAADFDQFVDAFTAPDPAAVFAQWADTERRPRIRLALIHVLVALDEEGR